MEYHRRAEQLQTKKEHARQPHHREDSRNWQRARQSLGRGCRFLNVLARDRRQIPPDAFFTQRQLGCRIALRGV